MRFPEAPEISAWGVPFPGHPDPVQVHAQSQQRPHLLGHADAPLALHLDVDRFPGQRFGPKMEVATRVDCRLLQGSIEYPIRSAFARLSYFSCVGEFGHTLHDLRHSFASQAAMRGIPLPGVARLLGHAQVQMTLRYAHVSDRNVEAAAERIGGAMEEIMNRSSARPESCHEGRRLQKAENTPHATVCAPTASRP